MKFGPLKPPKWASIVEEEGPELNENSTEISVACVISKAVISYQDVLLTKPSSKRIMSVRSANGTLFIDTNAVIDDFILIVLEQTQSNETMQCKIHAQNNANNNGMKFKLTSNKIHRICTMEIGTTIRPFDCITVVSVEMREDFEDILPETAKIWIPMKDRPTLIVAFCLTIVFGFVIGLYVSVALVKLFPKLIHDKVKRLTKFKSKEQYKKEFSQIQQLRPTILIEQQL